MTVKVTNVEGKLVILDDAGQPVPWVKFISLDTDHEVGPILWLGVVQFDVSLSVNTGASTTAGFGKGGFD